MLLCMTKIKRVNIKMYFLLVLTVKTLASWQLFSCVLFDTFNHIKFKSFNYMQSVKNFIGNQYLQ